MKFLSHLDYRNYQSGAVDHNFDEATAVSVEVPEVFEVVLEGAQVEQLQQLTQLIKPAKSV